MAQDNVQTTFVLLCSVFIFLMQLGFALLETGSAPRRHALNVFTKNFIDLVANALGFWACGFAFTMGTDAGGLIGASNFFLEDSTQSLLWFEQWVFAVNASTIFGGAVAGRTKFASYIAIATVTSAWIYPVVAHWVWHADGWLYNLGENGVIDFAGSGVVHMVGGVIGCVACKMVGPRHGYFEDVKGNSSGRLARTWGPHSMPMAMTGVGLLWVSWYGFNLATASKFDNHFAEIAGRVVVATTLCPAAATLTLFAYRRYNTMSYSLHVVANSALAGLVAITAACGTVHPWAAVVIGMMAAVVYNLSAHLLIRLHIDDPLEAAPVHMFGGAFGLIATGLFSAKKFVQQVSRTPDSNQYGLLLGGGFEQIGLQCVGVVAIALWTGANTFVVVKILQRLNWLRVDVSTEMGGLDLSKHGLNAYPERPTYHDVQPVRQAAGSSATQNAINAQRNRDIMAEGISNGSGSDSGQRVPIRTPPMVPVPPVARPQMKHQLTTRTTFTTDSGIASPEFVISVGQSASDEPRPPPHVHYES